MEGKENTVSGNVGHTPSIAAKQSGILQTPVTRSGLIPTRRVSSGGSGLAQKSTTPLGGTPSRAAALDSPRLAARSVPCSLCIAAEDALAEVHGRQTELEADLAAKQMEILDLKRRASLLEMELRAAETKTEQAREERARISSILDLSGGLARLDVGEDTSADGADQQQLRNAVRAAAVRFGLDSEDPLAALRSLTEVYSDTGSLARDIFGEESAKDLAAFLPKLRRELAAANAREEELRAQNSVAETRAAQLARSLEDREADVDFCDEERRVWASLLRERV